MGKKGGWFSAIKRVFSKDKTSNGSFEVKSSKEKRKGKGILSHGETRSFIPLFREPSSIEKILVEADQLLIRPPPSPQQPKTPPSFLWRPTSPKAASPKVASYRATSPKAASPRVSSARTTSPKATIPSTFTPGAGSSRLSSARVPQSRRDINWEQRLEPTLWYQHHSAIKIQAALRGYLARRNFRALRGLVRLQGVVRSQNVKRQTINAMKQMQLLVRVQTQIQSRRIQMLENQALQHQAHQSNKEEDSNLGKWTPNQLSEAGHNDDWEDSVLTKEEIEARLRKKVEAVIKRERSMAYAYSHQLWKANPKSAQSPVDVRSNGFPWWWNWLERQLPPASSSQMQPPTKSVTVTPPRPVSDNNPSPWPNASDYKHHNFTFNNHEAVVSQSPSSSVPVRAKQFQTPTRTPPLNSTSGLIRHSKPRTSAASSAYDLPLRDDDSLTSCPAFSVPNYMNPTVSAKAKVRATSNVKERIPGTPGNDSKRRFSFPLTPNIGSFKWNKGSSKGAAASQKVMEKHRRSAHSIEDFSIDSTVSMPAIAMGRKPFNRFV